MVLSICIPNFNRAKCLNNCLNSILISKLKSEINFEVCVSDNNSSENIEKIIEKFNSKLNIKFNRNKKNLGLGQNILNAVSMASGEFVWMLGNDDLLLPESLSTIDRLIKKNQDVDFFFVNSYNYNSKLVLDAPQPFDTKNLPVKMESFSKVKKDKILNFFDLINPKISYDFLLGIYLSVFRKKNWDQNLSLPNKKDLDKDGLYSTFDNTCPYIKIFSKGFGNSKAYVCAKPMSVNLYGEREWVSLYEFIEIVRIPEVLDVYRKDGLKLYQYLLCKNFALRNFMNYFLKCFLIKMKVVINILIIKNILLKIYFFRTCIYL